MKKDLFLILALILGGVFYFRDLPQLKNPSKFAPQASSGDLLTTTVKNRLNRLTFISVCDQSIKYRVDNVDPRFGLSKGNFLDKVKKAVGVWDQAINHSLFVYDPQGSLSINLVFDERQALNNQITQLENKLNQGKSSIRASIGQYETEVAEFKKRLDSLNAQIEQWNNQGGAPPDVYERLINEQRSIKEKADRLNEMAKALNQSTNDYNSQVANLDQAIDTFNTALEKKPEEGVFSPAENKIEVYFNINQNELIHTLAHELGHAIGLEHNLGQKSIMFPYASRIVTASQEDISSVLVLCQTNILPQVITTRIRRDLYNLGLGNLLNNSLIQNRLIQLLQPQIWAVKIQLVLEHDEKNGLAGYSDQQLVDELIQRGLFEDESGRVSLAVYQLLSLATPISCVDIIPVRRMYNQFQIGVIHRATGAEAGRLALVGGRVMKDEIVADAIGRHLKESLGIIEFAFLANFGPAHPFYVAEYMHRQRDDSRGLFDPTKHSIALTFLIEMTGEPEPTGEASDFKWIQEGDVPDSTSYNQGKVMDLAFKYLREDRSI